MSIHNTLETSSNQEIYCSHLWFFSRSLTFPHSPPALLLLDVDLTKKTFKEVIISQKGVNIENLSQSFLGAFYSRPAAAAGSVSQAAAGPGPGLAPSGSLLADSFLRSSETCREIHI